MTFARCISPPSNWLLGVCSEWDAEESSSEIAWLAVSRFLPDSPYFRKSVENRRLPVFSADDDG